MEMIHEELSFNNRDMKEQHQAYKYFFYSCKMRREKIFRRM